MKKSILILLISAAVVSCTKETVLPSSQAAASVASVENDVILPVVNFNISLPHIIYLNQGLNTLQSDSFSVSGTTCYATNFIFSVTGNPTLSAFKFYINGVQVKATITLANNVITVAFRSQFTLPVGNYNYMLQAKAAGVSGTTFIMKLSNASIVDNNRFQVITNNLPIEGNTLIMK